MSDYYLSNSGSLKSQPKRTIGNYVASHGILVPTRFDSLKDARSSGKPFIARSEHSQDYAGLSGLLDSPHSRKLDGIETEEQLKQVIFGKEKDRSSFSNSRNLPKQLCRITGQPLEDFIDGVSFSFWEFVPGYNRVVIADSSVGGRYHVITKRDVFAKNSNARVVNYSIVEENKVTQFVQPLTPALKARLPELITDYEAVRRLGNFDSKHCPIMEFQTRHGKNHFLQYHRTRDFSPTTFTLNWKKNDGTVEALFVRGSTPPEGFEVNATVCYSVWERSGHDWDGLPDEDASFDLHFNHIIPELNAKRRRLQIVPKSDVHWALMEVAIGHFQRTKLFKPEVSVVVPRDSLIAKEERSRLGKISYETNQDQKVPLHIVSDGTRAYVRRTDL